MPLPVTRPISALIIWIAHIERISEEKGPGEGEAESGARLGIGRDAAGVVIRGAGYQARTENVGKLRAVRLGFIGAWIVCDRQSRFPLRCKLTADNIFRS